MREPHFFLIEDDLEGIEMLRMLVQDDWRAARRALAELRNPATPREQVPRHLDRLEAKLNVLHAFLRDALDARSAELTDEAIGYKRDRRLADLRPTGGLTVDRRALAARRG